MIVDQILWKMRGQTTLYLPLSSVSKLYQHSCGLISCYYDSDYLALWVVGPNKQSADNVGPSTPLKDILMEFPKMAQKFQIYIFFVFFCLPPFWGFISPGSRGKKWKSNFDKNSTTFHPNPNQFCLFLDNFRIFMFFVGPTTRRAIYSETRLVFV